MVNYIFADKSSFMNEHKIAILGCSNLGLSIVKGLLDEKNFSPRNITVTNRNIQPIDHLREKGITVLSDNRKAVESSEIILVAVKPFDVQKVMEEIGSSLDPSKHILISVATGVIIKEIQSFVKPNVPVFRGMPNTAADVKESITCLCYENANDKQ